MNFNIFMPARLIGGKDCVIKNSGVFRDLGQKCLIVTGKNGARLCGALDDVTNALRNEGIEYGIFDEIQENPLVSSVLKGGKICAENNIDFVVAIGGGSPLDAGKAVAIAGANPDFTMADLYNRKIPVSALPLVLVGTTAGTGSEVTGVSVLTKDDDMTKKSIGGADCYGTISFLDPKYTYSMSRGVTVSTALDAFAHIIEGWFSKKCTPLARSYGKMALPLVFKGLKFLYDNPETLPCESLRDDLYYGSIYAGLQLNICGAAFPHTVGYMLTENFGIPHGRACTAFAPYFLMKAKSNCPREYSELLAVLGYSETEVSEVISALTDVENLNIGEARAKDLCERWAGGNKNFDNSPGGFTADEAKELLMKL